MARAGFCIHGVSHSGMCFECTKIEEDRQKNSNYHKEVYDNFSIAFDEMKKHFEGEEAQKCWDNLREALLAIVSSKTSRDISSHGLLDYHLRTRLDG